MIGCRSLPCDDAKREMLGRVIVILKTGTGRAIMDQWSESPMMKQRLTVSCIPRTEDTMILEREVTMIGTRGERRCLALFDSGASYSIIRPDVAETIDTPIPLPDPENWVFETARIGVHMHASHVLRANFVFDDSEARFSDEFIILDETTEELIIGATTMQKWGIKLDFDRETVEYRKTADRLRLIKLQNIEA